MSIEKSKAQFNINLTLLFDPVIYRDFDSS